MTSLTPEAIHRALGRFFPTKNEDLPSDCVEELAACRTYPQLSPFPLEQARGPAVLFPMAARFVPIDRDTLCTFRRENKALLHESFVHVLQLAQELNLLPVGQLTVAADGTKVLAHASKYSAVSYQRAGEMLQELELEVQQLLAKAEQADSTLL